jgi:hypothetical protein
MKTVKKTKRMKKMQKLIEPRHRVRSLAMLVARSLRKTAERQQAVIWYKAPQISGLSP